jgi:hypothetical protein
MKKQLLTITAIGAMSSVFAQLPVSTSPQNKKAVIEEFTGVHCGYCPDGHLRATNIYNADPNNVVLINIHSGGYATVNTGEPDFKTTAGNAIDPMTGMNIKGYPAGDVNRMNFGTINAAYSQQTVSPFGMAQSRGTWTTTVPMVKSQSAYCNVALQGTIDAVTRVLTVQVAVYYTANSPVGTNSLNVVLLESKIPGPQSNYGTPTLYNVANYNPDGSYNHNHVLRATLTGNFGIPVSPTTAGSTYTTTLTYTIPATYGAAGKTTQALLGRMEIAAFVTQTNTLTINAAHGPVVLNNFANTLDIASTNVTTTDGAVTADASVCTGPLGGIGFKFVNNGSTPVTQAVFSYNVNGGTPMTYTWTGSVNPMDASKTITLSPIAFTPIASNSLNITVLSVNGSPDQNPTNNTWTKIVPYAVTANTLAMQMDFTQDQWGSEVGWKVIDEVTSVPVTGANITAGTYADLGASGTQLHTHTFTVSANTCYKLVVTDAYGDGVNAGYGVGGYSLKSGVTPILTSNGQYGTGETKMFKSANVTGISAPQLYIDGVSVFPNPASNSANVSIDMSQNENVNMVITNALGQVVYNEAMSLDAGSNQIKLNTENWAGGLYSINLTTAKGTVNHKLTISK